MASMSPELASAIIASASRLGVDPVHLGTAISYETGGRFDPNLWGGKGNNHLGLIQFGPEERARYGVKEGQSAVDQMAAVENYLRDRGVKSGMGLPDIYSTINAGRPGLYTRSDAANGGAPGTVMDKVNGMGDHAAKVRQMLGVDAPVGALAGPPARAGAGVDITAAGPAPAPGAGGEVSVPGSASAGVAGPAPMSLAAGLSSLGQQMQTKPEFLDLMRLPMAQAQPNVGGSQQIAAALAKAYGIGG